MKSSFLATALASASVIDAFLFSVTLASAGFLTPGCEVFEVLVSAFTFPSTSSSGRGASCAAVLGSLEGSVGWGSWVKYAWWRA